MPDAALLTQAKEWADAAASRADEYSGVFASTRVYIVEHFGDNGLIAAYIAAAAVILVLVSRLAKITFSTIKYLIIPAVGLAFVATYFVSEPLYAILPVTVTAGALLLLLKG